VDLYRNRLLYDPAPLAYLAGRGFERDVVEQSRLGYAVGDELVPYLNWRGLSIRAARKIGLLDVDNQERFAGRIVFPEYRAAQPVWMVGRTLAADVEPRYLGMPGAKPLLGWDDAIVDRRGVCLVEGPLDLLALRKWGVPAMGLCGTYVSEASLNELAGWKRLYVALDGDDAGGEATDELVRRFGESVIRVQLPLGAKDPAELALRPDGAGLFAVALRAAVERHSRPLTDRLSLTSRPLDQGVRMPSTASYDDPLAPAPCTR
jgi:DNA primase